MKRCVLGLLGAALLWICAAGCGGGGAPSGSPTAPGNGTSGISGNVVRPADATPTTFVPSVLVQVQSADGLVDIAQEYTDSNGYFYFSLQPGTYQIVANGESQIVGVRAGQFTSITVSSPY